MGPTLLPLASKYCTSTEESLVSGPIFAEASQVTTKPPFLSEVTVGLSFTKLMPLVSTTTSPPTLLPSLLNLCAMIEPERVSSPRKKLLSRQTATKPPLLTPWRAVIDDWSWSSVVSVLSWNSPLAAVPSPWNSRALTDEPLPSAAPRSSQATTKLPSDRAVMDEWSWVPCVDVLTRNSPVTGVPSAWNTRAFTESSD